VIIYFGGGEQAAIGWICIIHAAIIPDKSLGKKMTLLSSLLQYICKIFHKQKSPTITRKALVVELAGTAPASVSLTS